VLALLLSPTPSAHAEPLTVFRNDKGQITGYGERRGNPRRLKIAWGATLAAPSVAVTARRFFTMRKVGRLARRGRKYDNQVCLLGRGRFGVRCSRDVREARPGEDLDAVTGLAPSKG
jgi:hypothetical protein